MRVVPCSAPMLQMRPIRCDYAIRCCSRPIIFGTECNILHKMPTTDFYKRAALFLIGCMGTRLALTFLAKTNASALPIIGALAIPPAIGIALISIFGLRKTGSETFGKPIWWNALRPVHALLWAVFAYMAIHKNKHAWKVLLFDTILGLVAWCVHHALAY